MTYIHEIGHSLGLSHPGPYDASDEDAEGNKIKVSYDSPLVTYAQDERKYTVMSYFGAWTKDADGMWSFKTNPADDVAKLYPQTPMLDDVAAIQAKYGADPDTRSDATVYGFHSTADRDVFDFTKNSNPI